MPDRAVDRIVLNGVAVDFAASRLTDSAGREVELRAQSLAVLRVLAGNAGEVVSKEALNAAVWPGVAVTEDSLVQCIVEIRRALGDEAKTVLRTVPKRGYRLDPPALATVRQLRPARDGFVATLDSGSRDSTPSIAVLPFDDMSASGDLGYLCKGLAEDVITMLARSPDVVVMARNSSFVFGGQAVDVRRIGGELGVNFVLEGSVRREGFGLRVTAQLIDASSGAHVWADRFDEAGDDPSALQDAVAVKIIGSLTGEVGQIKCAQYRKAWGADISNMGEYDYYLRGLHVLLKARTRADNDRAGRIWREGLTRYPQSTMLKVRLAWFHWWAGWNFWSDDPVADIGQAERLVREVLSEDNLPPEAGRVALWLNAFVLMQQRQFEASVREARRAVAMAPFDAHILANVAEVLVASADYETALVWVETAANRDPANPEYYRSQRAYVYRLMGRYEEAVADFIAGGLPYIWHVLSVAICEVRLGRVGEARGRVREALQLDPAFTLSMWRDGSAYSDSAITEAEIADLAAAGLPP